MFFGEEAKGVSEGLLAGGAKLIKDAVSAFKADPTKVVELENSLAQAHLVYEAAYEKALTERMAAVNATMQAESKSEHWMQWAWRPTCGFTLAGVVINNFILMPYFKHLGLEPIVIPPEVWGTLSVVVGVASWTRGQVNLAKTKE